MNLGVLGPLFVRSGSLYRTPSARKPRNVLATLLVHADQVVPVSVLMSELWEDEPPASGLTTLQTYILNLRKMFASATGLSAADIMQKVLVTGAGGYMIRSDVGALDIREYHNLVGAGWSALGAGDDVTGVLRLTEALRLWRGPALVDVASGRVLESTRRQLEESRLVVNEFLVDAKLRLGMYREVLTELAGLTADNPLHEGLQAQYMRALYLAGRRAQALAVFQELRRNLVDELGLEPESQVQRVHQAILTSGTEVNDDLLQPNNRPLGESAMAAAWGRVRAY
jgi:DNA-binding SARP family transcriptional activator